MSPHSPKTQPSLYQVFLAWLSQAPQEETDQLDALLDKHPPQGARSVLALIRNCLNDPQLRPELPKNLALRLTAANWLPGATAARAA